MKQLVPLFASLACICTASAVSATTLQDGLVLYLTGDGTMANAAPSGNILEGDNISVTATGVKYVSAPSGRGGAFDIDGLWHIHAGQPTCVNTGSFTIGLWLNRQHAPTYYSFFGTQDWTSGNNIGFSVNEGGVLTTAWGGGDRRTGLNFILNQNNLWQYLTVVVDRPANTITTYRNGVQIESKSLMASTEIESYIDSAKGRNLLFGRSGSSTNAYPSYSLQDEIALWKRALTATEVTALFAADGIVMPKTVITANAMNQTTWSGAWGNTWVDGGNTIGTIQNLGSSFTFDTTIIAGSVALEGTVETTLIQGEGTTQGVGIWDFSKMTGGVIFDMPVPTYVNASKIKTTAEYPLTLNPGAGNAITIPATSMLGTGGVTVENGTADIKLLGNQNAGGTYHVKTGATLRISSDGRNDGAGIFRGNTDGVLKYTVDAGATIEFTSINMMGWGRYDPSTAVGDIAGEVLYIGGGDFLCLSGRYEVRDGAVFNSKQSNGSYGIAYVGAYLNVMPNATVLFKGGTLAFSTATSGATAVFNLGEGAIANVDATTPVNFYRGAPTLTGTGRMNFNSTFSNKTKTLTINGPSVYFKHFANDLKVNWQGSSTLVLSDSGIFAMGNMTAAENVTLSLDVTGRTDLANGDTLLTWTGDLPTGFTFATEGIANGGVSVDTLSKKVIITLPVASGGGSPTNWSTVWQNPENPSGSLWENNATTIGSVENLGAAFEFDTNLTASRVIFSGNQQTSFTQASGVILDLGLWDFSGMVAGMFWNMPLYPNMTLSATGPTTLKGTHTSEIDLFTLSNEYPLVFDLGNDQTYSLTTVLAGTGGVRVDSGTADITLLGNQNAGGTYHVKTGATLRISSNGTNDGYGNFLQNPNAALKYTVDTGARIEFAATNMMGWGRYNPSTAVGDIAGEVLYTGGDDLCISGLYTIRDGAVFNNNQSSGNGIAYVGAYLNIMPNASVLFKGKMFDFATATSGATAVFNLGEGAIANVDATTPVRFYRAAPTLTGTGRMNFNSTFSNKTKTLTINGPSVYFKHFANDLKVNWQGSSTLVLSDRGTFEMGALTATPIVANARVILTLDVTGRADLVDGDTLLTWTGEKPANLTFALTSDYVNATLTVNEIEKSVTIRGLPIHVTSGTIQPNVMSYLQTTFKDHNITTINISEADANKAYFFTLTPTVDPVTGNASLDCDFRMNNPVFRTTDTSLLADITVEVVNGAGEIITGAKLAEGTIIQIMGATETRGYGLITGASAESDEFTGGTVTIRGLLVGDNCLFKAEIVVK